VAAKKKGENKLIQLWEREGKKEGWEKKNGIPRNRKGSGVHAWRKKTYGGGRALEMLRKRRKLLEVSGKKVVGKSYLEGGGGER